MKVRSKYNCIINHSNTFFSQWDLNMWQRRGIEYLEQYNFDLEYHPGKTNVVADVLSPKTRCSMAYLAVNEWDMECLEMVGQAPLCSVEAQPTLVTEVIEA